MDIKPIETRYNGYRFRSRLEARWAVYFDKLGIKYEYEPQGYRLPTGECYLPDFYLPDVQSYVEIKPRSISRIDLRNAKNKMAMLTLASNDKFGIVCAGDPVDNRMRIYGHISKDREFGFQWDKAEFIFGAEIMDDDLFHYHSVFRVGLVVGDRYYSGEYDIRTRNGKRIKTVVPFCWLHGFDRIPYDEQLYARQVRFEHGESPNDLKKKAEWLKKEMEMDNNPSIPPGEDVPF